MRRDDAPRGLLLIVGALACAGCSVLYTIEGPSRIWQEQQIPFIADTEWIPLVPTSPSEGPIDYDTVFLYGKDEGYGWLASGDVEVVALFAALPVFAGGRIANPEDCFWIWHNGMGGTENAPLYADGRPVFDGVIQYDRDPAIPPEVAEGVTLDSQTGSVVAVAWIRGADGYFWYSSSAVACTITMTATP